VVCLERMYLVKYLVGWKARWVMGEGVRGGGGGTRGDVLVGWICGDGRERGAWRQLGGGSEAM